MVPGYGWPFWLPMAHCDLRTTGHQPDPQVPFHGAALQPLVPHSVHTDRVTPTLVQNPALALPKLQLGTAL